MYYNIFNNHTGLSIMQKDKRTGLAFSIKVSRPSNNKVYFDETIEQYFGVNEPNTHLADIRKITLGALSRFKKIAKITKKDERHADYEAIKAQVKTATNIYDIQCAVMKYSYNPSIKPLSIEFQCNAI